MNCKFLIVLAAIALTTACNRQPKVAAPPIDATTAATAFQGRLEAATQISSMENRDAALRQVAVDAAKAKDVEVATKAVQGISTASTKDKTAEECAVTLAKGGDAKGATALAQMISSQETRDRALGAIAKNN